MTTLFTRPRMIRALLASAAATVTLLGAMSAPASAEVRPVPHAQGYDYSAGEPAIFGTPAGQAGSYSDRACSGSFAVAGDSGFFLLSSCVVGDGSVRGDTGYYADAVSFRDAEPTYLLQMREGNDAHQNVVDPLTGNVPGDGLVRGWIPTAQQGPGMLVGKMGIGSGWTEGRITGIGYSGGGTYLICTDAPATYGDQGGPVWRNDQYGVRALGTVIARTASGGACYRPIQETLYEFGAYLPSFGPDQGRPTFGRFAPGLQSVQQGPLSSAGGYIIDKGDDWRR